MVAAEMRQLQREARSRPPLCKLCSVMADVREALAENAKTKAEKRLNAKAQSCKDAKAKRFLTQRLKGAMTQSNLNMISDL